MALLILIALQLIGSAAAIGMLWRRSERQRRELAELRAQLDALSVQRVVSVRGARASLSPPSQNNRRPNAALTAGQTTGHVPPARAGPPEEINRAFAALPVSAPLVRNFALTLAALAPALGFATHVSVVTMVGAGVVIGEAMMLVSLIPHRRQAAWGGAFTAGAWAMLGLATAAARGAPGLYCAVLPIAGATGLTHAYLRRAAHGAAVALAPGACLSLLMCAAALALGSQIGMIGAPGVAFAAIVSCAGDRRRTQYQA